MYDFYKDDFFENRFKNNMEMMQKMFKDMDSLKNHFFKEQFNKRK